jgi:preprotein translocase subunit YajC
VNHLLSNAAVLWAKAPAAPADGAGSPLGGLSGMIIPLVFVMVAFYFILLRPQRREQSARQAMLDQLKKNDRIVTAGGIYGVVTNVNKDSDEVTVKVDESTNTKLRMSRSSIARVIVEEPAGDKEKK